MTKQKGPTLFRLFATLGMRVCRQTDQVLVLGARETLLFHGRHLKRIAPEPIIGVKYCVILVTIPFVISSLYESCFLSVLLYRCSHFMLLETRVLH